MNGFDPKIGLCARCHFCQPAGNVRGSVFYRCRRAESDPTYTRYPRLPVTQCPGFAATCVARSFSDLVGSSDPTGSGPENNDAGRRP